MSDSLTNILAALGARCRQSPGMVAGGSWAVRMPSYDGLKFNAVVRGSAWLIPEEAHARKLEEGDCFLLAGGQGFTIASEPGLAPMPAETVFADARNGVAKIGESEDVVLVSGKMTLNEALAPFILSTVPSVTVFSAATPEAESTAWLLKRIAKESSSRALANTVVADRLVEIIFIELLRSTMGSDAYGRGWLAALSDARLAPVLNMMHAQPFRPWTLQELAAQAHMSRSVFAKAFRSTVGTPPVHYLKRMRLLGAGHALRTRGVSVSAAACLAGYASDSAFVAAFRRVFACTPAQYVRDTPTDPSIPGAR